MKLFLSKRTIMESGYCVAQRESAKQAEAAKPTGKVKIRNHINKYAATMQKFAEISLRRLPGLI